MNAVHNIGLQKYRYTVNCTIGKLAYVVIAQDDSVAHSEVARFFRHDPKFKILSTQKTASYK